VEALAQEPSLTTISPPATSIGGAAATALIKKLAQMDIPDPEKLWCGFLEVRESTGKAPK
jgi:DNA-binding LacI/PurR family transcriptional regulator